MEEHWNFRNYVACHLKTICDNSGTKEFTTDELAEGAFVEAMLDVLRADPKKLLKYSAFFKICAEYYGKPHFDIPKDITQNLFETFKEIICE